MKGFLVTTNFPVIRAGRKCRTHWQELVQNIDNYLNIRIFQLDQLETAAKPGL